MDAPAYTLREIARELNLPESTIRYYRDAFALYLPSIGMGRRRRYPAEALELFRVIAESYSQNLNREAIEAKLQEVAPLPAPAQAHTSGMAVRPAFQVQRRSSLSDADNQQLVANIMDGERERRGVMWQNRRQVGHLG